MKKFLIILISIISIQTSCFAIPNPKSLEQDAINSNIKEIARVQKIKVTNVRANIVYKTVTFRNSDNITFSGKCVSDKKFYIGMRLIGALYMEPKRFQLVYVTIDKDGGNITTYQPVTKRQAKKFLENPEKIKYDMGKAYIED